MSKDLIKAVLLSLLFLNVLSISLKHQDQKKLNHLQSNEDQPVVDLVAPEVSKQMITGGWSYHSVDQQSDSQKEVQNWIRSQIKSLDGFTVKRIGTQVVAGVNYLFDFQNEAVKQKVNVKVYQNLNGQNDITFVRKLKLIERDDGTLQDKSIVVTKQLQMSDALNQIF